VEEGRLRRDLFYRLNVYAIHLLPLRERREDILPLAEQFLATYGETRGARFDGFAPEAIGRLTTHSYPGNARELKNIVELAAIQAGGGLIQAKHVRLQETPPAWNDSRYDPPNGGDERARLMKALERTRWNRRQAAIDLGIPYSTFRYKLQKLGID